MKKFKLFVFLLLAVLCLQYSVESQAAQTINGKALGSVDDVVKEISKGDLSLKKEGLITVRGITNSDNNYLDVFATTFSQDSSASSKRKLWSDPKPAPTFTVHSVSYRRPAVSRRLYDGKKALMLHNAAPNGSLKYYFKTLSNNRSEYAADTTTDALVNSVEISDISEYTPARVSDADNNFIPQVYGTRVMPLRAMTVKFLSPLQSRTTQN